MNSLSQSATSTTAPRASGLLWLRKWAPLLIKLLVFICTLLYLYQQIWIKESWTEFWIQAQSLTISATVVGVLAIAATGTLLNWGLEAYKWQWLLRGVVRVSYVRACQAVLTGAAVSLWMPNRVGEYLGRILYVKPQRRIRAALASVAGSLAQLLATLVFGAAGLVWYAWQLESDYYFLYGLTFICLLWAGTLLGLYFQIDKLPKLLPRKAKMKRVRKWLRVYSHYTTSDLAAAFGLSVLRYLTFSFQFWLMFYLFGISLPMTEGLMLIFFYYLLQTALPSTLLTELGVRGALSVFVFGDFAANDFEVLAPAYGLWLLNLLLPALAGLVLLLGKKLK